MSRSCNPMQKLPISFKAGTKLSFDVSLLQQAFQIVQYHKRSPLTQVLQEQVDALFEGGGPCPERLWREHLQTLIKERFQRRSIAQGAKNDHLERTLACRCPYSQLVHDADRER